MLSFAEMLSTTTLDIFLQTFIRTVAEGRKGGEVSSHVHWRTMRWAAAGQALHGLAVLALWQPPLFR